MFGPHFYHKTTRKVVTLFGTMFNDISVIRYDSSGNENERFKVPIIYGPKEKWLYKLTREVDFDASEEKTGGIQDIWPKMSFFINSYGYDTTRKLNTMNYNINEKDSTNLLRQLNPVPYNLEFELGILCKYVDDSYQILEQILPYFTPSFSIQYIAIPELSLKEDLYINLTSVQNQDTWTDDWSERRSIVFNLTFNVQTNYYPPITDNPMIRKIILDTHLSVPRDPDTLEFIDSEWNTIPREIRNTLVPDPIDAQPEDDFGFTETIEEFSDGKVRDPITGDDVDIVE